jgi:hypothetical protein
MMVTEYEAVEDLSSLVREGKLKELKELVYSQSENIEIILETRDWVNTYTTASFLRQSNELCNNVVWGWSVGLGVLAWAV